MTPRRRIAVHLVILCVLALTSIGSRAREEVERRRRTIAGLRLYGSVIHDLAAVETSMPPGVYRPNDPTAQYVLVARIRQARLQRLPSPMFDALWIQTFAVMDGWGRGYVYRCPGPIHTRGWDLYSVGPDGRDEDGHGDDLLVGEDLPSGSARATCAEVASPSSRH